MISETGNESGSRRTPARCRRQAVTGPQGRPEMALWRFGRGWSEETLKAYLQELEGRCVNFDADPETMTPENGWTVDGTDKPIGAEWPGPPLPDGVFARARSGVINYDFSDPRIVVGHFDPRAPL